MVLNGTTLTAILCFHYCHFMLQISPQAAVRELETAVRIQPDLAQAYYQLSRAYTVLGETSKSQESQAAFAKLKQQELDEDKQMMEEVQRQSSSLAH